VLRPSRFTGQPGFAQESPPRKQHFGHSPAHVAMRDQILRASSTEELLELSHVRGHEFDFFHAVTAFRRLVVGKDSARYLTDPRFLAHLTSIHCAV